MPILKNISILILALSLIYAHCQAESNTTTTTNNQHQTSNQTHPPKDAAAQPNIVANAEANSSKAHPDQKAEVVPVKQDMEAIENQIKQIKQDVLKSGKLDYEYIEGKINEVIGSMTAEQKEQFQLNLSGEARAAYEHYRQSKEQRDRKQQQQDEKLKEQTIVNEQDQILGKQKDNFKKNLEGITHKSADFSQLLFQISTDGSEDFRFTLPSDQKIVIYILNYISEEGVFSPITTTKDDKPLWIYVYQNRDKLVSQSSFYSKDLISFSGKTNSSYLIRYVNHGKHRLVNMHMSNIILQSHIEDKLTVEDVADHRRRIFQVKSQLTQRMNQAGDKWLLEQHNQKKLLLGFDHYYFYNIGEIIVLGVLCVVQVEYVRKLLANNNVI